ncbi:hypothetical protein [Rhizobium sp. NFR12]|uniref:hypothetical protein n=1 Tax=Rhizobium sp. NFR12 TaxID=1566261 RepID=UPI0008A7C5BF|nr:hypothetical protein [Rhizobium sp. NFR12]SEH27917.1 hypothetical protein SAMN03159407_3383 [Rhizobium sp. NFR12]
MLKFDDPQFIDQLYELSGRLKADQEIALESKRYAELARLTGIEQGLILAINMARHGSARVPPVYDVALLGAVIATLHEDRLGHHPSR